MLASPHRLSRSRDIARVYTRGAYTAQGPLAVKFLHTRQPSRAVVVVGKKVAKRATIRNRIRRRLAAILAAEWATVIPGYDIVVTVREDVAEAPNEQLHDSLITVLKRAKLIRSR